MEENHQKKSPSPSTALQNIGKTVIQISYILWKLEEKGDLKNRILKLKIYFS